MWVLFWSGFVALGSGLSPAQQERFAAAVEAESAGRWAQAAAHYGVIVAVDAQHEAAVLGLGRALEAQGDTEAAIQTYERLGENPRGVEARAFLMESIDPHRAAELYRLQQTIQLGDAWPYLGEARALKRVDPLGAADAVGGYLDLVVDNPKGSVILDVIGELRAAGHDRVAEVMLERIVEQWPMVDWIDEVRSRLDRLRIERSAQYFRVNEQTPLSIEQQASLARARKMATMGEVKQAVSALSALVRSVPSNPEIWGALGDIHLAEGDIAEAEVSFIRAITAAPNVATWHARFGALLSDAYAGKRDREARDAYRTALSLRPTWTEVAFRLAELERGLRDYDAALDVYRTVIEMDSGGPWGRKAQQRLHQLGRKAPEIALDEPSDAHASGVSPDAATHFRLARAYRQNEQVDEAAAEAALAVKSAPRWTSALNLLAALEVARGNRAEGKSAWLESLAIRPQQPGVLLAIGELAAFEGDVEGAATAYERASQAGSVEALYRLAEWSHTHGKAEVAREHLAQFFAQTAGGPKYAPAVALAATLDANLRRSRTAIGSGVILVVAMVGLVGWRRVRRRTLADLTERVPGTAHDVSLVVSAIRHELLKHNTSLLDEMSHALEVGDDDAVVYGAERLFGSPDREGVTSRYDAYLERLVALGRSHGFHIDLRHSDPIFGPISRSMAALYRIRRKLLVPPVNATDRSGLSGTVSTISHSLNVDAYQQLGALLTSLSTCELSEAFIRRVDRRVRSEPGFEGHSSPALEIEIQGPTSISSSRGDLEDILTNLIRNALQALMEHGSHGDPRVGIRVQHQTDDITGLLRASVSMLDTARGHLSTQMITEAEVRRGLGLVRDLAERNGGSVWVADSEGWSKAVVVDLDRVDGRSGE